METHPFHEGWRLRHVLYEGGRPCNLLVEVKEPREPLNEGYSEGHVSITEALQEVGVGPLRRRPSLGDRKASATSSH